MPLSEISPGFVFQYLGDPDPSVLRLAEEASIRLREDSRPFNHLYVVPSNQSENFIRRLTARCGKRRLLNRHTTTAIDLLIAYQPQTERSFQDSKRRVFSILKSDFEGSPLTTFNFTELDALVLDNPEHPVVDLYLEGLRQDASRHPYSLLKETQIPPSVTDVFLLYEEGMPEKLIDWFLALTTNGVHLHIAAPEQIPLDNNKSTQIHRVRSNRKTTTFNTVNKTYYSLKEEAKAVSFACSMQNVNAVFCPEISSLYRVEANLIAASVPFRSASPESLCYSDAIRVFTAYVDFILHRKDSSLELPLEMLGGTLRKWHGQAFRHGFPRSLSDGAFVASVSQELEPECISIYASLAHFIEISRTHTDFSEHLQSLISWCHDHLPAIDTRPLTELLSSTTSIPNRPDARQIVSHIQRSQNYKRTPYPSLVLAENELDSAVRRAWFVGSDRPEDPSTLKHRVSTSVVEELIVSKVI